MNKRIPLIIITIILMLFLTSCSITPVENVTTGKRPQRINPVQIIEESTATPEPIVIARDPVKSHSPMRVQMDVPSDVSIPEYYHALDLEGINHCIYAFVDVSGETKYRVYAEVDEEEDNNVINTIEGFYNANVYYQDGRGFYIETNKDEAPISLSGEMPASYTPCYFPTKANIRKYMREMSNAEKKYKKEYETAEKSGEALPEPTPWDGTPILNNNTEAKSLPNGVKESKKVLGLYYYVNIYGENEYRRYAALNENSVNFFYSNEDGTITAGSLPINTVIDFDKSNFKSGKAQENTETTKRIPVLVQLTSGEYAQAYEVIY